jgi:hypothetical protein
VRVALAYIVVVLAGPVVMGVGALVSTLPVAFALERASMRLRVRVCGLIGGIGGVAAAVAFGYGVFRLLAGRASFTLFPFLATTLPLLRLLAAGVKEGRALERRGQEIVSDAPEDARAFLASEMEPNHWATLAGQVLGLVLAAAWFAGRRL